MKLNNRGWGLIEMVALVGILFFFFLLSILLIRTFYANIDKNKNEVYIENNTSDKYVYNYTQIENNLKNAADNYMKDKYISLDDVGFVTISMNKLIDFGYYSNVSHEDCKGYVISQIIDGEVNSKPYISCNNYVSPGFESGNY